MSDYILAFQTEFDSVPVNAIITVPHQFFLQNPSARSWFLGIIFQYKNTKGPIQLNTKNCGIIDILVSLGNSVVFKDSEGTVIIDEWRITCKTKTLIKQLIDPLYCMRKSGGHWDISLRDLDMDLIDHCTAKMMDALKRNDKVEIMRYVQKCNESYVDADGNSLLLLAERYCPDNIMRLLVLAGFDLYQKDGYRLDLHGKREWCLSENGEYDNCMSLCVALGNRDKVNEMLANGMNPNQVNIFGETPLFVAIREEQYDIFHDLIDAGADISYINRQGIVPLQVAGDGVFGEDLVNAGCSRISKSNKGGIVWNIAVGTDKKTEELFKNIRAVDTNLLVNAIFFNNQKEIDRLIGEKYGLGIKEDFEIKGETPLTMAIRKYRRKTVEKLISAGYDLITANKEGDTPLIIAARIYWVDLVKVLLEKGCDRNQVNKKNESCKSIAESRGVGPLFNLLNAGVL